MQYSIPKITSVVNHDFTFCFDICLSLVGMSMSRKELEVKAKIDLAVRFQLKKQAGIKIHCVSLFN